MSASYGLRPLIHQKSNVCILLPSTEKANPYCYTNSYPEVSLKGYNCGTSSNAVYLILLTPTSQAQIASSLSGVAASLRYSLSHTTITNGAQLTAINEEIASLTSAAAVIATESVGEGALNEDSASASESDVTFSWSQPAQPSLPDASALSSPAVVSSLESNFPSPSSSSSSSSSSQGLPPSIIAAIAVPTVVGAIFFAALTVFLILCIRKRNRRRRDSHNPAIGPYTSPYQQPPNNGNAYAYPDTYGVNKDFRAHSQNGVSPSHPSMSAVSPSFAGGGSPHPVAVAEMEGTDPYLAATNRYQQQYQQQQGSPARSPARSPAGSPALNRENLDALSKSGSQPRHSDELARERRLSGDGTTAVPEPSVAGRTNWTTDSFNVAGGRRGGY